MIDTVAAAALVFAAALLYSAVGHGGASGYLAVMALLGTAPAQMRTTALVLNVFVASIAAVQFARAGHFQLRLFLPFAVASVPAAFLGGRISLGGDAYQVVVGVILVLSAIRFVVSLSHSEPERIRPLELPVALVAGALLGFVAGLTGVGGGIFLSPLLVMMRWATLRTTAAVSAMFILVNSIAGLAGRQGGLDDLHPDAAWWVLAAIAGGTIGSHLGSRKLSGRGLRGALAAVLLIAGVKLIV